MPEDLSQTPCWKGRDVNPISEGAVTAQVPNDDVTVPGSRVGSKKRPARQQPEAIETAQSWAEWAVLIRNGGKQTYQHRSQCYGSNDGHRIHLRVAQVAAQEHLPNLKKLFQGMRRGPI